MNWNEYKALAIRTESIPAIALTTTEVQQLAWNNTNSIRMLHATMGACTELAELLDGDGVVNFVEEAGDVLWYLAIADDVVGFYIDTTTYMNKPPIYWLGELNDAMKRHIFYGKELDIAKMKLAFNNLFIDLENALNKKGFTLALAMEANIRKLEKRYPEKMFTAQAAIHRDVDRELDHIMENGELIPKVETLLDMATMETKIDNWIDEKLKGIAVKWAELIDGLYIWPYDPNFDVRIGRNEISKMVLKELNCTVDELHAAVPTCQEYDFCLSMDTESGIVIQAIPQDQGQEKIDPFADSHEVIVDLDAESFTALIFTNLTASQISALAMDMCFEMAATLRQVGATMEARGYDMLYSQCGDFAKDPKDYSLYNMWATLEYPTTRGEVSELLERWK